MKYILTSILILILMSCKQETSKEVIHQQEAEVTSTITQRIDFDEAVYYSFEDLKVEDIFTETESESNTVLQKVATQDRTSTLQDTVLITKLEGLDFQKVELPKGKVQQLSLLLNRKHRQKEVNECLPIYRDILFLKKKGEITHILKICFECLQTAKISATGGEKIEISDYRYLERLLKR